MAEPSRVATSRTRLVYGGQFEASGVEVIGVVRGFGKL